MQTLDYETPRKRAPTPWPFLAAFFAAFVPGLMLLVALDEAFGTHIAGIAVLLSLVTIPQVLSIAVSARASSTRCDSPLFAATMGLTSPQVFYLLLLSARYFISMAR